MKMKITKVLMVVMINKKNNIHEGVVGILTLSLQPSLQQKGRGHLLRLLMKESHHITEIISSTVPEEPMNRILLLIMPMQDSQTVT